MHRVHSIPLALLGALLLTAGCGRDEGDDLPAAEGVDTTNESAMDGLSREQILEQAEAISPEEAEARGIIDTTVHIPDPTVGEDIVATPPAPPLEPLPRP